MAKNKTITIQSVHKKGKLGFYSFSYALIIVYSIIILIPIYFVIISSFKENATIYGAPLAFPTEWHFSNYFEAQQRVNILGAMRNSFIVAIGSELLVLLLGFPAAFAMSRIPTRLSKVWETIFSTGFLIPGFAIMVPIFFLFFRLHLLMSPASVIMAYAGLRLPLTVIFLASHMRKFPHEIEESAELDGANWFQIMIHIFLPLSVSGLVTILIMNFIFAWNEYLLSLMLLGEGFITVQRALPRIVDIRTIPYGVLSAAIVISTLPVYLIFILFQKRIMRGMASGAVKS